jgi:cyclic beta-1,2-glucan synthetase
MYRVGIEAILGLSLERGALRVDPCIPKTWPGYKMTFRSRNAEYRIAVENPDGVNRGVRSVDVDGRVMSDGLIPIIDDGGVHHVRVVLGG